MQSALTDPAVTLKENCVSGLWEVLEVFGALVCHLEFVKTGHR